MKTKWDNLVIRSMNTITIRQPDDLKELLYEPLCLSGKINEEIEQNAWHIMLADEYSLQYVTVQVLESFFEDLIREKERHLGTRQATLYVWFDGQSLQLCFNILSGVVIDLPFGCHLREVSLVSNIIHDFLEAFQDPPLSYDKITFLKPGDEGFDDDAYEEEIERSFILDVYVKFLNKPVD